MGWQLHGEAHFVEAVAVGPVAGALAARRSTVGGRASMVGGEGAASKRASIAPTSIESEGAPSTTGDSELKATVGSMRASEMEPNRRPGERRGSVENTKVSSLKSSKV